MKPRFLRVSAVIVVVALAAVAPCGCLGRRQAPPAQQAPTPGEPGQPAQPGQTAQPGETPSPVFPVTLVDGLKREVRLPSRPGRIISMAPAATEILFALGAGDRVIGVSAYCNYPAEVKNKEKIGDYANPSLEKIVSLKPDLVVGDFFHSELGQRLAGMGIPTLLLNCQSVSDVFDAIRLVGKATGDTRAAETVCSQMESRVLAVRKKVETIPEKSRPKVFHEMWHEPLMTSGPGTIMDDLIRLAGGINVAADAKTMYPEYSLEALIAKNPDVIVYTDHYDQGQLKAKGSRIKAVKEGRVYLLTDDLVSRPGPRIVDGLEELARKLHPDLFK